MSRSQVSLVRVREHHANGRPRPLRVCGEWSASALACVRAPPARRLVGCRMGADSRAPQEPRSWGVLLYEFPAIGAVFRRPGRTTPCLQLHQTPLYLMRSFWMLVTLTPSILCPCTDTRVQSWYRGDRVCVHGSRKRGCFLNRVEHAIINLKEGVN